jgi:hypothetical protein
VRATDAMRYSKKPVGERVQTISGSYSQYFEETPEKQNIWGLISRMMAKVYNSPREKDYYSIDSRIHLIITEI